MFIVYVTFLCVITDIKKTLPISKKVYAKMGYTEFQFVHTSGVTTAVVCTILYVGWCI